MRRLLADIRLTAALLVVAMLLILNLWAMRGTVQAATPAEPDVCTHVATAAEIKIYYCDSIDLFVNQFGFMVFEP